MNKLKPFYLPFLFFLIANYAFSRETINFSKLVSGENIETKIEMYTGKSDIINEVQAASNTQFEAYSWDKIPTEKSVTWLRFTILNEDNYEEKLVIGNNQFQFIEFYELGYDSTYKVKLGGSQCDHNVSEIVLGASSWFSFSLPPSRSSTYYMRVSNNQKIKYQYSKLPFSIYKSHDFISFKNKQTFFNYFFWGALIIITFYNFVLYFQLRSRIYLFYVFNNIIILLFVLSQSGLISELFLTNSSYHEELLLVFGNIAFIFYVLFCKEFLDLKTIRPKLNRTFNWILLFWPVPLLLIPLNQSAIAVSIGGLVAIWGYTMIMVTAYRAIKKGDAGARFFYIANMFYYIATIISILQIGGILPSMFLGLYAINFIQIGTLLQVSLFSLTVGSRILKMQNEIAEKQIEQERIKTEEEQKRRILIEEQNQSLERKVNERTIELQESNEELKIQSEILEAQKALVEEKQKEIIDSITYAKRIQYTLLAHEALLEKHLPEHFVLFNPKDIVSGDFYWAIQKENKFYFAICDCTGHGVPGAFMSLLNISFLNEAITEKNILSPDKILDHVRQRLTISQDGAKDGMDGTLICITEGSSTIEYASAYNKPILIRDNTFTSLAADKMPVGRGERNEAFSLFTIDIVKGDKLYFYTDGYADQFGGPKGKKFKYKALNELLLSNHLKACEEQKEKLIEVFNKWQGKEEQVDDICVVGLCF